MARRRDTTAVATNGQAKAIHPDDQPVADLWLRYASRRNDVALRNRLVEHYFPRAAAMAARMAARIPRNKRDEAVSQCHQAMLRAVRAFQPVRGTAFLCFLRAYFRRAVLNTVRAGCRGSYRAFDRLQMRIRAVKSLVASLGRVPTDEEIAARLGWTVEELWHDREGVKVSLHDKLADARNGKAFTLLDVLESRSLRDLPSEDPAAIEGLFIEATAALGFQERLVLFLLHCRGKKRGHVARTLGLPARRVAAIEKRALAELSRAAIPSPAPHR